MVSHYSPKRKIKAKVAFAFCLLGIHINNHNQKHNIKHDMNTGAKLVYYFEQKMNNTVSRLKNIFISILICNYINFKGIKKIVLPC